MMDSILICGDFVCQDPSKVCIGNRLRSILASSKYKVINFEAPLSGFGKSITKSGPALTQSIDSPQFLNQFGFNIIMLANNHIMDTGLIGLQKVKEHFSKETTFLGAGNFQEAYDLQILNLSGFKVGLYNITHKEFGIIDIDNNDRNVIGAAWMNHPQVNKSLLNARKKCDFLIVLPHAGIEDLLVPLPEIRARYQEFIDFGADIVIGSHPHVPQSWEVYNNKQIIYSLGNFYFQSHSTGHDINWYRGNIVELNFSSKMNLNTKIYSTIFTPTSIDIDDSSERIDFDKWSYDLLNNTHKYQSYLNSELNKLWETYHMYILRGTGSVSFRCKFNSFIHAAYGLLKGADMPLLLNNFQCESHRWAIERMIKLQMSRNE